MTSRGMNYWASADGGDQRLIFAMDGLLQEVDANTGKSDLKAVNTFADPRRVASQRLDPPAAGARMTFNLPPRSYTVAHLGIRA